MEQLLTNVQKLAEFYEIPKEELDWLKEGNYRLLLPLIIDLYTELKDNKCLKEARDLINAILSGIGILALEDRNLYLALNVYKTLEDSEKLRELADLALSEGYTFDSIEAYRILDDETGLRKCVAKAIANNEMPFLSVVIPKKVYDWVLEGYKSFSKDQGFSQGLIFNLYETLNSAYELALNYDVGVGIARGGLYSSYIFSLFGLPVLLAESHRKGRGATFKWHSPTDKLKNKRVLVFDKDVKSGRTLKRVIKELQKHTPKQVDLFLNHNPIQSDLGHGSLLESIPNEYNEIFYPSRIRYDNFYDGLLKLQRKMKI